MKLLRAVLESDKVYCTKAVEPLDNLADQLQQSDTWAPSSPLKFTAKLLCSAGRCIGTK